MPQHLFNGSQPDEECHALPSCSKHMRPPTRQHGVAGLHKKHNVSFLQALTCSQITAHLKCSVTEYIRRRYITNTSRGLDVLWISEIGLTFHSPSKYFTRSWERQQE